MLRSLATRVLGALAAGGTLLAVQTSPSTSLTSTPDESVAFGDLYHLNRCVASRGGAEASLQVEGEYGWLIVGKGPFVRAG